jgi:hypothetical protein
MTASVRVGLFTAADLAPFDAAASDPRSSSAVRAWGCRRVPIPHPNAATRRPASASASTRLRTAVATHGSGTTAFGQINPKSLVAPPVLPRTALDVDPVARHPMRHCGGWTALKAYHQYQGYYLHYGNAGRNAATSQHHNFPNGGRPIADHLYGREPTIGVNRLTKVRRPGSAAGPAKASVAVGTR